jgi:hypothetical protein
MKLNLNKNIAFNHVLTIIFGEKRRLRFCFYPNVFFFYQSNMSLLLHARITKSLMNKSSVYKLLPYIGIYTICLQSLRFENVESIIAGNWKEKPSSKTHFQIYVHFLHTLGMKSNLAGFIWIIQFAEGIRILYRSCTSDNIVLSLWGKLLWKRNNRIKYVFDLTTDVDHNNI